MYLRRCVQFFATQVKCLFALVVCSFLAASLFWSARDLSLPQARIPAYFSDTHSVLDLTAKESIEDSDLGDSSDNHDHDSLKTDSAKSGKKTAFHLDSLLWQERSFLSDSHFLRLENRCVQNSFHTIFHWQPASPRGPPALSA